MTTAALEKAAYLTAQAVTAAESIERTIGPICFEKYFG